MSALNNEDCPKITLAVFAFNQEGYIREAVEGAFAQDYHPLEIILSDDCSSDSTFQIMQQMADSYTGPHSVIARRNHLNLGTAQHVQSVADIMSGALLVVAAGDDVSLPYRVSETVSAWRKDEYRAPIVHGALNEFEGSDPTRCVSQGLRVPADDILDLNWYMRKRGNPTLAPTTAYAKRVFTSFPPLIGGSIIEDGPLSFRGFLLGTLVGIPKPLVLQRKHQESSGTGYSTRDLSRWNVMVRSRIISNFTQLRDLREASISDEHRRTLEKYFLSIIRQLSHCIFPERIGDSLLGRIRVFLSLCMHYPSHGKLIGRVIFAARFSNLLSSQRFDALRSLKRRWQHRGISELSQRGER